MNDNSSCEIDETNVSQLLLIVEKNFLLALFFNKKDFWFFRNSSVICFVGVLLFFKLLA